MKVVRFFVAVLLVSGSLQAASADMLFIQKQWGPALAEYAKSPRPSAQRLMAMGQCALHLQKGAEAITYFRRAQRKSIRCFLPAQEAIEIIKKTGNRVHQSPGIAKVFRLFLESLSLLFWQIIALLFCILGIILLRKKKGLTAWICLILALIGFVASLYMIGIQGRIKQSFVAHKETTLRSGPGDGYEVLGTIAACTEMTKCGQFSFGGDRLFYKVKTEYGGYGWVPASTVVS